MNAQWIWPGLERCWALACGLDSNKVAIGYDEGTIVIALGHEKPVCSMDPGGKLIWAVNNDIKTGSIKGVCDDNDIEDGEKIPVPAKDLGSCELYPQHLM